MFPLFICQLLRFAVLLFSVVRLLRVAVLLFLVCVMVVGWFGLFVLIVGWRMLVVWFGRLFIIVVFYCGGLFVTYLVCLLVILVCFRVFVLLL